MLPLMNVPTITMKRTHYKNFTALPVATLNLKFDQLKIREYTVKVFFVTNQAPANP
jgi:hypothetical protein